MDLGSLHLRPYQDRDQDGVIALLRACYAEYDQVLELDTLDDDLRDIPARYPEPHHTFQVLVDGERVIGTTAVHRTAPREAELKRVFLDAAHRGRGLGKYLSLWAIDWARRRGHRVLHIWSDSLFTTAHALYRHLGAEATGERRELGGVNQVFEDYFRLPLGPEADRKQTAPEPPASP